MTNSNATNLFERLLSKVRKPTLRELCVMEFGEEFGDMYDDLNRGIPIGGFAETIEFVGMVEAVKEKYKGKWRKS